MQSEIDTFDKIYELLLNLDEYELAWEVIKKKNKRIELYLELNPNGQQSGNIESDGRND